MRSIFIFFSWYLLSLDKISSFVEQLCRPYMRHYIGDASHLYVSLMLFFFLLLSLLVSVVSFQLGAMLACHNYWHWAVYHIEKVRTLSLLYHPNSGNIRRRSNIAEDIRITSEHF